MERKTSDSPFPPILSVQSSNFNHIQVSRLQQKSSISIILVCFQPKGKPVDYGILPEQRTTLGPGQFGDDHY
jgi:hypothetical protein